MCVCVSGKVLMSVQYNDFTRGSQVQGDCQLVINETVPQMYETRSVSLMTVGRHDALTVFSQNTEMLTVTVTPGQTRGQNSCSSSISM